jgi:diguanylate cyclase (GGDEF)-like protein
VTISIGGALFPEDGTTLDTLRKRSDDALYRAKRAGRNRCMFTATVMH